MKNKEFYHWIQGYLELCPEQALDMKRVYIIRNHLNLVRAVEGYLGEYNSELYKHSEAVISAVEQSRQASINSMAHFMKTAYIGDPTASNLPSASV